MAKVTSKLQVTIPKALAERFGIRAGDEIEWIASGGAIRIVPSGGRPKRLDKAARLALLDASTARQRRRQRGTVPKRPPRDRGWTREDLYRRGRTG